jgi:hypothetical protein
MDVPLSIKIQRVTIPDNSNRINLKDFPLGMR